MSSTSDWSTAAQSRRNSAIFASSDASPDENSAMMAIRKPWSTFTANSCTRIRQYLNTQRQELGQLSLLLCLGLHLTLYYFVSFLRFLTFNFFSVRPIFIRVNCWSMLQKADLTMNCELPSVGTVPGQPSGNPVQSLLQIPEHTNT